MTNPFLNDSADVFDRMLYAWQNNSNKCSIGKITSLNGVTVNIQPLIKYFDPVTRWETHPILNNVPIAQLQNPLYSIRTPLNIGDIGLLLWFDREVYSCLTAGAINVTVPDSADLNDAQACIFIPIVQPLTTAIAPQQLGVDFVSSEVSLMTELLQLLSSLTTFMTAIITAGLPYVSSPSATVVGAYPIALTAAANAINTTITSLTTALTKFKGDQ